MGKVHYIDVWQREGDSLAQFRMVMPCAMLPPFSRPGRLIRVRITNDLELVTCRNCLRAMKKEAADD